MCQASTHLVCTIQMKILIIGANSYVGARLYFDLRQANEVIGTYHVQPLSKDFLHLDITKKDEVDALVSKVTPNLIVHVAACASSRSVDKDPEYARQVNISGTQTIVEGANTIGARVHFMSSAVVLGDNSLYGQTKVAGEEIVKKTKAGFIVLRPHTIFGLSPNVTNDRPFNRFLKNLDTGTPAIYDTSWKFQPTYLKHISEVIHAVLDRNITNDIIPIACNVLKSRFDLARDILTPFGIRVIPEDKHDTKPVSMLDLNYLDTHNLPTYTYEEMIAAIVDEIKQRDMFAIV